MGRPTKAESAQIAERRTKAIAMRARRESWQAIADALEYASPGAACEDVNRALKQRLQAQGEQADTLRELELQHLDELAQKVLEVLERQHVTVSHGKIIKGEDGKPLLDDDPVLRSVDRLVRIAERRAKLTGLDSPVKVHTEGVVTFRVEGVDMEQLR